MLKIGVKDIMSFKFKKQYTNLAIAIVLLVGIPLTVLLFQNATQNRSRAEKSVVLSFDPMSSNGKPIQVLPHNDFSMDIVVDPGNNLVSLVKLQIQYDPSKVQLVNDKPFIPNLNAFSQIIDGPTYVPGKVSATLSIGTDLTKAIRVPTKVGSIRFHAMDSIQSGQEATSISFTPDTQVLSISSNSSPTENVIANTQPANVYVGILPQTENIPTEPSLPAISSTCTNDQSDSVLIFDKSGSMKDQNGSSGTKLLNAQIASDNYIDILAKDTRNRIGLVSFSSSASLNSALTSNYQSVKDQVNNLHADGETCMSCAINKARQELAANGRVGIKKVAILLTDGIANSIEGHVFVSRQDAEKAAIAAVDANPDIAYYTIGLGNDVDKSFLQDIAARSGGQYYFSPTTDDLFSIYQKISVVVAKGSVSGILFNDANRNGVPDDGEQRISGWKVHLFQGTTAMNTATTDEVGSYHFGPLCDGTYQVKQVLPGGYTQSLPSNADGYTVTISKGSDEADKNFADDVAPTPSLAPTGAQPRCSDGRDNDVNGFSDSKDSTCHTDGNPTNTNSYDPGMNGENGGLNTCGDSKDNNNNGAIDGADPVCHTDKNASNANSYNPNLPESEVPVTLTPTPTPSFTPTPTPSDTPTPTLTPTNTPVPTATPTPTITPTPTPSVPPTAVPTPLGNFRLSVNVILHGVGSGGDNVNLQANTFSNKNPQHPVQLGVVSIFDKTNTVVATAAGYLTYNSLTGSYAGIVATDSAITDGNYIAKVTVAHHLTRLVPGIQDITVSTTKSLATVDMVTGDVSNDNRLDILDYNSLLNCYSDLASAPSCTTPELKTSADINDDGAVNQFDYNLFLREISTQPGQ